MLLIAPVNVATSTASTCSTPVKPALKLIKPLLSALKLDRDVLTKKDKKFLEGLYAVSNRNTMRLTGKALDRYDYPL